MRAFSLLELMVTIAIAGILAGLAIGLGSEAVQRGRAHEELESVRALLVTARNHARRNAACVRVVRSTTGSTLTAGLHTDAAAGCPAAPLAAAPPIVQVDLKLSSSSEFQTFVTAAFVNRPEVIFTIDGSLRQSAPTSLTLTGVGRTHTLLIWPAAGIVKEAG